MNHTPDQSGPEPPGGPSPGKRDPEKGFWRSLTASDWVELAIYVFFGLIALLAGIGWAAARW
ncbi:hypothetical protein AB0B28_16290 [Glycomyces sp. NPDC046736]|uniref:hypothetical protein n=1 Tax=Glycomyces sp. NPDC046736 TaxID=3155615 RepID=UPI0033F3FCEA